MKLFELQENLASKKTPSVEELAKKHNVSVDVIRDKIKKGTKVELEHTEDPAAAREIAMDHIAEVLNYYEKLEKYVEN